jgi:hypothetical protein
MKYFLILWSPPNWQTSFLTKNQGESPAWRDKNGSIFRRCDGSVVCAGQSPPFQDAACLTVQFEQAGSGYQKQAIARNIHAEAAFWMDVSKNSTDKVGVDTDPTWGHRLTARWE